MKTRKIPLRTCVVTKEALPKQELLRIVRTPEGDIEVDETGTKTSLDNVYAGGDAVTGAATVILAMEAGKKAAKEIIERFK